MGPRLIETGTFGPDHTLQVENEQISAPGNKDLRAFLVQGDGVAIDPVVESRQIELTDFPDDDRFRVWDAEAGKEASYCAEDEDSVAHLNESAIDSYVQHGSLQRYNRRLRTVMAICV